MRSLLTSLVPFGNAGLPQTTQGVADAFRVPHTLEKSGHFCFCHQLATGVPCGRGYILAEQRPDVRETQAALCRPGSVVLPFFCALQPLKLHRCSMLRFFLSSRYLRLRHRLFSQLATFAVRTAATAVLGALLALPVLYFVEVL